jgi:serine/threonine-protein kinase RsbW
MEIEPDTPTHRVDISVPLHTRFAATLRLLTSALGADAGFSIDEIDDLRMALNEVFVLLVEQCPGARAMTTFEIRAGALDVTMRAEPARGPVVLDQLARNILQSAVDDHALGPDGITLSKRATESIEGD